MLTKPGITIKMDEYREGDMARGKKLMTFRERLVKWAEGIRQQASQLPPGPERDALLKKASQTEIAAHLDEWASTPGLQPPK